TKARTIRSTQAACRLSLLHPFGGPGLAASAAAAHAGAATPPPARLDTTGTSPVAEEASREAEASQRAPLPLLHLVTTRQPPPPLLVPPCRAPSPLPRRRPPLPR
ncbi:unnamed protein product, partial [Ectocarpus sp. 13 AM-2016]